MGHRLDDRGARAIERRHEEIGDLVGGEEW